MRKPVKRSTAKKPRSPRKSAIKHKKEHVPENVSKSVSDGSALISKALGRVPFGMTAEEISLRIRLSMTGTQKLLDDMTEKKKITRTHAGRAFFYRLILTLFLVMATVNAEELTSTNYKIVAEIVDAAGGNVSSPKNNTMLLSMSHVSSVKLSESYQLCAGFLCSFWDIVSVGRVTFMLSFNLNGSANDEIFVDNFTETRRYEPGELSNYYACLQDSSLSGSPIAGLVFAGSRLDYISVAPSNSYNLRIAQDIPGNKLIIPVTGSNCAIINPRMAQIAQYGTILQPFIILNGAANAIELALDYRAFDISGAFDKTGPFTLVIEKNETNENQIIIKPE